MALEAALAVPLFLFFVVNMIWIIEIIRLQDRIGSALHQAGNQAAYYAYYYRYGLKDGINDAAEGPDGSSTGQDAGAGTGGTGITAAAVSFALSQTCVRNMVMELAGKDYLDASPLKGGSGSISYLRSSILSGSGPEADIISLTADYRAGPLIPWLAYSDILLQSRYYGHAFVGYTPGSDAGAGENGSTEEEEIVFVTESGTVYHRNAACSYLKLSVEAVDRRQVSGLRNNSRAKYYPCEICRAAANSSGTVYITDDGNRYHCSRECSGLKRTIRAVPLSSAAQCYGPCSRCGQAH
ncbi:MAG: hypothetical protein J6P87_10130 [Lachnospiraceae bacterium]|nr:hypothetical protein [Lachnospiraceae bacterium]